MLRKIRKMLKHQEGFTLVELMIVVVILGILAGVGIQQYGNIQQKAKDAADEANRKVLVSATNMYLMLASSAVTEDTTISKNLDNTDLLVPTYLDEWPDNPKGGDYVVTITVGEDGSYSVEVSVEVKPES